MKLLFGVVAYLAVVVFATVAVLAGLSSIERREAKEGPVLAMSTDDWAGRRERVPGDVRDDPNRVPVWIAPTPKYEYTPQPIEAPKRVLGAIGKDARGAMAKENKEPRREPRRIESGNAPALIGPRHRDNDPFFRD